MRALNTLFSYILGNVLTMVYVFILPYQEVVKSEIEVMNQLNHASLIQLYAAYESRTDITLVME